MSPGIPGRARQLAVELERLFVEDSELAKRLNDTHRRLLDANDRLWSGLDPDGLAAVSDHPQFEAVQLEATLGSRSQILESSDLLGQLQQAHWTIHRAHHDYQQAAEARRVFAADIGEVIARFVVALVAAGWSEEHARSANVHEIATADEV